MIITRKIEIYVHETDKQLKKNFMQTLYGWRDAVRRSANLIVSHKFVQQNVRDFMYLQEDVRERFKVVNEKTGKETIKYHVSDTLEKGPGMSEQNVTYRLVSSILKGAAGAVENFFSGLLFGVIFAVYFLLDEKNSIVFYWGRAFRLIFGDKHKNEFMIFMKDADNAFSGYIRGQMVDAVIVGVLSSIALSIAGIPYAVLIGICMGFGNLIPYFGPIIGYAATVIVCIPSGDWGKMILGVAIIAIIMFIDGNIINPRLLSANVDVHPLLVVAALLGGGVLGGIAGMLVAVPTAALLKLQFDRYLQKLEDSKESMLS